MSVIKILHLRASHVKVGAEHTSKWASPIGYALHRLLASSSINCAWGPQSGGECTSTLNAVSFRFFSRFSLHGKGKGKV
jgi:hypothetical protein